MRHFLPELAFLLIYFGQYKNLVARADGGVAEQAAGVDLLERSVASRHDHAGVVGPLREAAGAVDVIFQAQARFIGDGVGEQHFAADQYQIILAWDADDVAVFQQHAAYLAGLGDLHLADGFYLLGALHPFQAEIGFVLAQAGFVAAAAAGGKETHFQVVQAGLQHFFLSLLHAFAK